MKTIRHLGRGAFGQVRLCLLTTTSSAKINVDETECTSATCSSSSTNSITTTTTNSCLQPGASTTEQAPIVQLVEQQILVAVKLVDLSGLSKQLRKRALKEAKLLQKLSRHPNIVDCKDVLFSEKDVLQIVLEYAKCGDLHQHCEKSGRCSEAKALCWGGQVLSALAYCHAKKILHRDLKPANILLFPLGRAKLADFGVCFVGDSTSGNTTKSSGSKAGHLQHQRGTTTRNAHNSQNTKSTVRAKTVIGTPHYFAPELVNGEEYGPASDMWSFGVCLYESIAFPDRPFTGTNLAALALKISKADWQRLPDHVVSGGAVNNVRFLLEEKLLLENPKARIRAAKGMAEIERIFKEEYGICAVKKSISKTPAAAPASGTSDTPAGPAGSRPEVGGRPPLLPASGTASSSVQQSEVVGEDGLLPLAAPDAAAPASFPTSSTISTELPADAEMMKNTTATSSSSSSLERYAFLDPVFYPQLCDWRELDHAAEDEQEEKNSGPLNGQSSEDDESWGDAEEVKEEEEEEIIEPQGTNATTSEATLDDVPMPGQHLQKDQEEGSSAGPDALKEEVHQYPGGRDQLLSESRNEGDGQDDNGDNVADEEATVKTTLRSLPIGEVGQLRQDHHHVEMQYNDEDPRFLEGPARRISPADDLQGGVNLLTAESYDPNRPITFNITSNFPSEDTLAYSPSNHLPSNSSSSSIIVMHEGGEQLLQGASGVGDMKPKKSPSKSHAIMASAAGRAAPQEAQRDDEPYLDVEVEQSERYLSSVGPRAAASSGRAEADCGGGSGGELVRPDSSFTSTIFAGEVDDQEHQAAPVDEMNSEHHTALADHLRRRKRRGSADNYFSGETGEPETVPRRTTTASSSRPPSQSSGPTRSRANSTSEGSHMQLPEVIVRRGKTPPMSQGSTPKILGSCTSDRDRLVTPPGGGSVLHYGCYSSSGNCTPAGKMDSTPPEAAAAALDSCSLSTRNPRGKDNMSRVTTPRPAQQVILERKKSKPLKALSPPKHRNPRAVVPISSSSISGCSSSTGNNNNKNSSNGSQVGNSQGDSYLRNYMARKKSQEKINSFAGGPGGNKMRLSKDHAVKNRGEHATDRDRSKRRTAEEKSYAGVVVGTGGSSSSTSSSTSLSSNSKHGRMKANAKDGSTSRVTPRAASTPSASEAGVSGAGGADEYQPVAATKDVERESGRQMFPSQSHVALPAGSQHLRRNRPRAGSSGTTTSGDGTPHTCSNRSSRNSTLDAVANRATNGSTNSTTSTTTNKRRSSFVDRMRQFNNCGQGGVQEGSSAGGNDRINAIEQTNFSTDEPLPNPRIPSPAPPVPHPEPTVAYSPEAFSANPVFLNSGRHLGIKKKKTVLVHDGKDFYRMLNTSSVDSPGMVNDQENIDNFLNKSLTQLGGSLSAERGAVELERKESSRDEHDATIAMRQHFYSHDAAQDEVFKIRIQDEAEVVHDPEDDEQVDFQQTQKLSLPGDLPPDDELRLSRENGLLADGCSLAKNPLEGDVESDPFRVTRAAWTEDAHQLNASLKYVVGRGGEPSEVHAVFGIGQQAGEGGESMARTPADEAHGVAAGGPLLSNARSRPHFLDMQATQESAVTVKITPTFASPLEDEDGEDGRAPPCRTNTGPQRVMAPDPSPATSNHPQSSMASSSATVKDNCYSSGTNLEQERPPLYSSNDFYTSRASTTKTARRRVNSSLLASLSADDEDGEQDDDELFLAQVNAGEDFQLVFERKTPSNGDNAKMKMNQNNQGQAGFFTNSTAEQNENRNMISAPGGHLQGGAFKNPASAGDVDAEHEETTPINLEIHSPRIAQGVEPRAAAGLPAHRAQHTGGAEEDQLLGGQQRPGGATIEDDDEILSDNKTASEDEDPEDLCSEYSDDFEIEEESNSCDVAAAPHDSENFVKVQCRDQLDLNLNSPSMCVVLSVVDRVKNPFQDQGNIFALTSVPEG
ncbi:unnamed protein product [Amoebophrya sp. A120]|nr:unnamed protein product [Amoebophrya sp. A120]|eukprot:GSA120T00008006001.1